MQYSFVIPAYNEADSLAELLREIRAVMDGVSESYEIVVVNDGSEDGTSEVLESLIEADPRIREIELARNLGKSAAYMTGFGETSGEIVITLDADLQDDPAEIPHLLEVLDKEDYDLVVGWKQARLGNEPGKALPSKLFNAVIHLLFGLALHDSNCGFRVMRRSVARSLELYGDIYRFIPELAHVRGHRVCEVPVQHRRRKHGRTKYGPLRFLTGFLDLLAVCFVSAFKQKPLQFFGALSLPLFAAGGGLELYVLFMRYVHGSWFQTHVAAIIIGVFLLLMGVQTFATGLIAEIIVAGHRRESHPVRRRNP